MAGAVVWEAENDVVNSYVGYPQIFGKCVVKGLVMGLTCQISTHQIENSRIGLCGFPGCSMF